MRVLVTGGAGFIGSAVVRFLIRETAAHVLNVDKLTYAASLSSVAEVSNDPRYAFAQLDVTNMADMHHIMRWHRPDWVIHLAAETHVDRSIDGPADFVSTSIIGTYALLEAATGYLAERAADERHRFRFLHVSTDEVYGSLGPIGAFTEDSPYRPNSPYAASKASADHLVRAWARTYRLPAMITNCSNNFGPYQYPEKLIPVIIHNALTGCPLPIYGDGCQIRDWLYVDDHVRALIAVLSCGTVGDTYNVGGNNECTNLALVTKICHQLDQQVPSSPFAPHAQLITFVPDRPGHDRRYAIDSSKIVSELTWIAKETLDSAIPVTVAWYVQHPEWFRSGIVTGKIAERIGLGSERVL